MWCNILPPAWRFKGDGGDVIVLWWWKSPEHCTQHLLFVSNKGIECDVTSAWLWNILEHFAHITKSLFQARGRRENWLGFITPDQSSVPTPCNSTHEGHGSTQGGHNCRNCNQCNFTVYSLLCATRKPLVNTFHRLIAKAISTYTLHSVNFQVDSFPRVMCISVSMLP